MVVDNLVAIHPARSADVVLAGGRRRGPGGRLAGPDDREASEGRHRSENEPVTTVLLRVETVAGYVWLKRSRYCPGATPTMRWNVRRMDSAVPRPLFAHIASRLSVDSSRRRRAVSTRADATKRAGVIPTSRVNTRAKFRELMATRRASAGTERSSCGWSTI